MGKTKTAVIEGKEKVGAVKVVKETKAVLPTEPTEQTDAQVKAVKKKISVNSAKIYIYAAQNNTIISFTDNLGNVFFQTSAGASGFKNTKKGTPYAGAKAMEFLVYKLKGFDIKEVRLIVKGIGPGREPSIRALFNANVNIVSMEDRTPIPFGGPTLKKARRV
ncbi:MAG: 30S ribosomal protein S11 [Patescibacteria group bacterium]